tara:strand:+ start:207 stop:749 length:543 start_codon:yes stop_codon:yes gene_type:complete
MKKLKYKKKPKIFLIDVDGVMTNGQFIYNSKGKEFKIFGPDDHDGLSLLKQHIKIEFVTGDKSGFKISKRRIVHDMKFKLNLVSTIKRLDWIKEKYNLDSVIYMGDGIFDHYVMRKVLYSIAPKDADTNAKKYANYITKRNGGNRAVAEASLHILQKFFVRYDPDKQLANKINFSGKWKT